MERKKYNTDEERKTAMKAYNAAYYQKNKEEILARQAAYRAAHKKEIAAYRAAHKTERAEYLAAHKDEILAKQAEYNATHKEEKAAYDAERRATPFGRATYLVCAYRQNDKKYNRGECTLTPEWVVDNIFTQPCHYCCETDWNLLGCDRIDNTKPHTPENVVPCCSYCNAKKHTTPYDDFMRMIGKKS